MFDLTFAKPAVRDDRHRRVPALGMEFLDRRAVPTALGVVPPAGGSSWIVGGSSGTNGSVVVGGQVVSGNAIPASISAPNPAVVVVGGQVVAGDPLTVTPGPAPDLHLGPPIYGTFTPVHNNNGSHHSHGSEIDQILNDIMGPFGDHPTEIPEVDGMPFVPVEF